MDSNERSEHLSLYQSINTSAMVLVVVTVLITRKEFCEAHAVMFS